MPHLRLRYLLKNIRRDLSWSPIISVLGMRQVGKTTLLRQLGHSYLTLDDDDVLRRFEQGLWSEIESGLMPMVIDEAQKCPGLFDRVKLIVDRRKKPGQFLLAGSVRFLSQKQIRESLTGRTSILELYPLTLSEVHRRPLYDFIGEVTRLSPEGFLEKVGARKHYKRREIEYYLNHGGLPGICFKRDEQVRLRMFSAHLETLLMRDLQFLVKTRIPFIKLKSILLTLAQNQGQVVSLSDLGRRVQVSTPTIVQLMRAFEDLFLIRPHGKNCWYFADSGIATYLGTGSNENRLFHLERFVYHEMSAQINYGSKAVGQFGPYLTRGGVRVPFVVESHGGPTLAVVVDATEGASEKSLKSLTWFSRKRHVPVVRVVLHSGDKAYLSATGALCMPYEWIA